MTLFDTIAERPLNQAEKQILDIYNTVAILLFKDLLSIDSLKFLVVLMRVNNIAQEQKVTIQTVQPATTGLTVADYRRAAESALTNGMMR